MTEEIRYKISFDQSVSSGIIGFHGTVEFTDREDKIQDDLVKIIQSQEEQFREAGYRVASDIKPKEVKEK